MKKYISVIVFIVLGTLLWQYSNRPQAISQEVHHAIQSKIAELITNDILKKNPQATDIQIEKLYTAELNENKIKVTFAMTFKDPATGSESSQQGEAIFHREPSDQVGKTLWRMQSRDLLQNEVTFTQDEIITSDIKTAKENSEKQEQTQQESSASSENSQQNQTGHPESTAEKPKTETNSNFHANPEPAKH